MTGRTDQTRDLLWTRRSEIRPEEVGIEDDGRRRVPGLRRGEVARLAGISTDYYARIERGDLGGVSPRVLERIASALRLDEAARRHLLELAGRAPVEDGPGVDRSER